MLLAEPLLVQINSSSKFIIHLPSASCQKACNMTPLKFVLTSTPGGGRALPSSFHTYAHTHTLPPPSLLMEQAEPLMLKRLQLSVSRWGEGGGCPPLGVITVLSHILTLFHFSTLFFSHSFTNKYNCLISVLICVWDRV